MRKNPLLILTGLFLFFASTSWNTTYQSQSLQYISYRITDTVSKNSSALSLLKPYSDNVNRTMNEVVGIAEISLEKKQPECTLGNFLADAFLVMAQEKYNTKADISLINFGGMRLTQVLKGEVTNGKIFELMPFDNLLILQKVKGDVLQQFLDLIAAKGGWPVAGMTIQIKDKKAVNVMIAVEKHADIDIVLLDLVLPGMTGQEAVKEIRMRRGDLPCIVLTASGGIDTVVQAMQAGASDFFVKPASPERIMVSIRNALEMSNLKTEVVRMKKRSAGQLSFNDMVANAPVMAPVVRIGKRAAASNIPVLITGESGVGKELLARAIKGASERAGRPFVTVNCGAIPENLVESILFGHVKGSFTGATENHAGKFVEAHGGTLFLDEVGELPLDMQVKLLRVLQEGEVDPVGGKRPMKVDVRIISATNKDLAKLVAAGAFREDLYYRLNVFPIEAPPLRDRKEDLATLVQRFIARFNAEESRNVHGASPATMNLLMNFDWPGNVRQLENSVFRAVILCEGDVLEPEDFPQISGLKPLVATNDALPLEVPVPANDHHVTAAHVAFHDVMTAAGDVSPQPVAVFDGVGHLRQLEQIERDLIELAIDHYAGHMSEVARRLGIGRSTLYRKLREYGLEEKAVAEG